MKTFIRILLFVAIVPLCAQGQYRSERPLEMSFEQSDFYFNPAFLNPQGVENFKNAAVLTSEDPLNDLQRNSANLVQFDQDTLPSNYFYIDFRNNREIIKEGYPGYNRYNYAIMPRRWGYYHTTSRGELTPLISVAYLKRLPVFNNSLTVGITYQLINQAEKYYAIPTDIYRNFAGKDLLNVAFEGTEDYDIEDRYSASDNMYHEGHSMNMFLGWEVNNSLNLGLKAGKFLFGREGSLGSDNLWNDRNDYYSYWKKHENRMQEYDHWDFSLGLTYSFNNITRLGLNAGILTGNVLQNMEKEDESISQSGEEGSSRWSDYQSWHTSDQGWDHTGNTYYSGLQWEQKLREYLDFRLMYSFSHSSQDLRLNSNIESESENEYYYESTDYLYESEGYSNMHDYRNGDGERTINMHSIKSSLNWQVTNQHNLKFGVILGMRKQSTETSEDTDAFSENYRYYHRISNGDTYTNEYYYKTVEDKTIHWEFNSRLRSLQIPVIYEYNINERFDLLAGINRKMNFWKIENTTLILYDYREREENGEIDIETMTGERISEPDERISIINTNFLFGLTFSPAQNFNVQFLASPGVEDHSLLNERITGTQYWLNVKIRL